MQLLEGPSDAQVNAEDCAREVLDVVPLVMRIIRGELRRRGRPELTVPQFRSLAFLDRAGSASLSELADHIGLTLPSASKLVDGLVDRGLATRAEDPVDRRRMSLCLTDAGHERMAIARASTQAYLAQRLNQLTAEERSGVDQAMRSLRQLFAGGKICQ